MGNQELANHVRCWGGYFARRRSQRLAIRAAQIALIYLAFHIFGVRHTIPMVFDLALFVIIIRLENVLWNLSRFS